MWVELIVKGNVANCLKALGRVEEELALRREIYAGHLILRGPRDMTTTIVSAVITAGALYLLLRYML